MGFKERLNSLKDYTTLVYSDVTLDRLIKDLETAHYVEIPKKRPSKKVVKSPSFKVDITENGKSYNLSFNTEKELENWTKIKVKSRADIIDAAFGKRPKWVDKFWEAERKQKVTEAFGAFEIKITTT